MTLFDGNIITARYTSAEYDVIEILYHGAQGATSYIIENNPTHPDYEVLVKNGWDADAIQEATVKHKKQQAFAFSEMLQPHIEARINERIKLLDAEVENSTEKQALEIERRMKALDAREAEVHRIVDERHSELTQREADMSLSAEERLEEFNKREAAINKEYAKIDTAHKELNVRQDEMGMTAAERLEEFNEREANINKEYAKIDTAHEEFNKREAEIHRIADKRHVEVDKRERDLELTAEERLAAFEAREKLIRVQTQQQHEEIDKREQMSIEEKDKRIQEIQDQALRVDADLKERLEARRVEIEERAVAEANKIMKDKQNKIGKLDRHADVLAIRNVELDKELKTKLFNYLADHAEDKNMMFEFKLWAMEDKDIKSSGQETRKAIRKSKNIWTAMQLLASAKLDKDVL